MPTEQIHAGTPCALCQSCLCAQYEALDMNLETCSSANTLFKKAKEQEIASIQPSCKPGSAENCHFFGSKEGILKPMRKCNGLIYLDGSVFL